MGKNFLKRSNQESIYASFERGRITALLGARRVGKTTLLQAYMKKHPKRKWVFFNMDHREERQRIGAQELEIMIEEGALKRIGKGEKIWVAIDEAQKCPALFDQVKILYDREKDTDSIKFILTGSGHLNLHQLAAESLAGRVELMHLREFNLKELTELTYSQPNLPSDSFLNLLFKNASIADLETFALERRPFQKLLSSMLSMHLIWGGLPEVAEETYDAEKKRYLGNYLQTYLENDVRAIETISDLDLYQKLMKVCAQQTGSLRDDQKLLSALPCTRNTLVKYRGYLIATMQYKEVFPYIDSAIKRLVKSPKGYLINNGLVSYLTGIYDLTLLESTGLLGHRFENWLLGELLSYGDTLIESHTLYFWRTHGGHEVDFVLTIGREVFPIEVTYSKQVLPKKIRHLKEFLSQEKNATWGLYVYNGPFHIDEKERIIALPPWII